MFRKMRRFKQELTKEECIRVLKNEPRGVLSVYGEDGYPYAFPMNYIYMNDKLYFHCAKTGHKIDAVSADSRVSFCVMDKGFRKEGDWALNINSIIVFGNIKRMAHSEEAVEILRQLGLKYFPTAKDVEEAIRKSAAGVQILELSIDHMTGKLVNES